jgi:hypothetical protein
MANHEIMEPVLSPRGIEHVRREASIAQKVPRIMGSNAIVLDNAVLAAWYGNRWNPATIWWRQILDDPARFEGLTSTDGRIEVGVETYINTECDPCEDIRPVLRGLGVHALLGDDGIKPYGAVEPQTVANYLRGDSHWEPSRFHNNPLVMRRTQARVVGEIRRRLQLNDRAERFWSQFPYESVG